MEEERGSFRKFVLLSPLFFFGWGLEKHFGLREERGFALGTEMTRNVFALNFWLGPEDALSL
jgi:hypothetical protein